MLGIDYLLRLWALLCHSFYLLSLSTLYLSRRKVAEKLEKVGLNNVQDLLFHLPLRYEDRTSNLSNSKAAR